MTSSNADGLRRREDVARRRRRGRKPRPFTAAKHHQGRANKPKHRPNKEWHSRHAEAARAGCECRQYITRPRDQMRRLIGATSLAGESNRSPLTKRTGHAGLETRCAGGAACFERLCPTVAAPTVAAPLPLPGAARLLPALHLPRPRPPLPCKGGPSPGGPGQGPPPRARPPRGPGGGPGEGPRGGGGQGTPPGAPPGHPRFQPRFWPRFCPRF